MGEHLVIDQDSLARKNPAQVPVLQHPALNNQVAAREVLEDDQILVTISQNALRIVQSGKQDIAMLGRPEADDFEG